VEIISRSASGLNSGILEVFEPQDVVGGRISGKGFRWESLVLAGCDENIESSLNEDRGLMKPLNGEASRSAVPSERRKSLLDVRPLSFQEDLPNITETDSSSSLSSFGRSLRDEISKSDGDVVVKTLTRAQ
jgi:hypothetical protein